MPQILQIADILDYEAGVPIPMLACRVKTIWDRKQGNNKRGHWSFENMLVEDLNDNRCVVKLKLDGMEPFQFNEGDEILLCAEEQSGGFRGLEADEEEDRRDRTQVQLIIHAKEGCEIIPLDEVEGAQQQSQPRRSSARQTRAPARAPAQRQRTSARQPARQTRAPARQAQEPTRMTTRRSTTRSEYVPAENEAQAPARGANVINNMDDIFELTTKNANLYLMCWERATELKRVAEVSGLEPMNQANVEKAAVTIYMSIQGKKGWQEGVQGKDVQLWDEPPPPVEPTTSESAGTEGGDDEKPFD